MTKTEYITSFCAEYCGQCRLPKPELCTWKEIAAKSWDAAVMSYGDNRSDNKNETHEEI